MLKYGFLALSVALIFSFQNCSKANKNTPAGVLSSNLGLYSYFEEGFKCTTMFGGPQIDSPVDSYGFSGSTLCHYGNACNDVINCAEVPEDLAVSEDGKQLTLNGRVYVFTARANQ